MPRGLSGAVVRGNSMSYHDSAERKDDDCTDCPHCGGELKSKHFRTHGEVVGRFCTHKCKRSIEGTEKTLKHLPIDGAEDWGVIYDPDPREYGEEIDEAYIESDLLVEVGR